MRRQRRHTGRAGGREERKHTSAMASIISWMALGSTPGLFLSPCMVWVFPAAVWPYAKMVPLYPCITPRTIFLATLSKTLWLVASGPNT